MRLDRGAALLAAALFAAAVSTSQAIGFCSTDRAFQWSSGLDVLALGWMAVFVAQPAWFANPLLGLVCILLWQGKYNRPLVLVQSALVACAFLPITYPLDEGGVQHGVICAAGRGPGFWLWLAAHAVALAGLVRLWRGDRRTAD